MGIVINKIITAVRYVYRKMIVEPKQEANFWVLYSFLFAFVMSRFTVYYFPEVSLIINGVHVHHFAYGFILLALAGILSLNGFHEKKLRFTSALYGFGLGVAADEFGMWIHLKDDYWVRQSYDAVIEVLGLLISAVYFSEFWHRAFLRVINVFMRKDSED